MIATEGKLEQHQVWLSLGFDFGQKLQHNLKLLF